MRFNNEQTQAINHKEGACAVIAGAGSGKSTVLVNRIKKLVDDGVCENEIVAITFTDNSSKDLKTKLEKLNLNDVIVGTFHSICRRILIKEGINTSKMLKSFEIENEFRKIEEKPKMNDIISFISYQKNYGINYDDNFIYKESIYDENTLRIFYEAYEKLKIRNNALDFDDWLLKARDILKNNKNNDYTCSYILVDEHQDSNLIQNELIDLLCPSGNIFCVFDYRQAIYTFRGSNPEYCMNFKQKYKDAKIINMNTNYRSSNDIVERSNNFIKKYYGDYEFYADAKPNNNENSKINVLSFDDKESEGKSISKMIQEDIKSGIQPNEIAVIYRMNQNSFEIERELKKLGIKYDISSKNSFFNRREINAIICMLRLINNPDDNTAFEEIFNFRCYPMQFISKNVFGNIIDLSARKNISLFDASEFSKTNKNWERRNIDIFRDIVTSLIIQHKRGVKLKDIINNVISLLRIEEYIEDKYDGDEMEERLESLNSLKSFVRDNTLESLLRFVYSNPKSKNKNNKNAVKLMTVHKSKGLEFKKVYLIGIQDGKFPNDNANEIDEARLFYVGVTRSKSELVLSQIFENNQFVEEYMN